MLILTLGIAGSVWDVGADGGCTLALTLAEGVMGEGTDGLFALALALDEGARGGGSDGLFALALTGGLRGCRGVFSFGVSRGNPKSNRLALVSIGDLFLGAPLALVTLSSLFS